jgi:hypothetical protein
MNDVQVSYMANDQRPAFVLNNVTGADLQHIRAQKMPGVPSMVLKNVNDLNVFNSVNISNTKRDHVVMEELK